eukprot:scaffold4824_cov28-Tisochrysis_lutea.AAC.3
MPSTARLRKPSNAVADATSEFMKIFLCMRSRSQSASMLGSDFHSACCSKSLKKARSKRPHGTARSVGKCRFQKEMRLVGDLSSASENSTVLLRLLEGISLPTLSWSVGGSAVCARRSFGVPGVLAEEEDDDSRLQDGLSYSGEELTPRRQTVLVNPYRVSGSSECYSQPPHRSRVFVCVADHDIGGRVVFAAVFGNRLTSLGVRPSHREKLAQPADDEHGEGISTGRLALPHALPPFLPLS